MTRRLPLLVQSMTGLGDSIYQRPYVRELSNRWDVYLMNSWPQLYSDTPVRFVPHPLKLRTQQKNVRALPADTWAPLPDRIRRMYLGYDLHDPADNILTGLDRVCRVPDPFVFDLPPLPPCPVPIDRPIAVIRPVTERGEWLNRARNCDPKYVAEAAAILQGDGFRVVSVADLQAGIENMHSPVPPADIQFHRGELAILDLLSLVAHATVVVGPIGWILPAAVAAKTPLVLIAGGHGAYNRPDRLTDPRLDLAAVRWILPDPFCMCANMLHRCPKRIPNFGGQFRRALDAVLERAAVAA